MTYVGIQLKDRSEIEKLEKALSEIGINGIISYKPNESGIYGMGNKQKYLVELSDFTAEELREELNGRE